MKELIRPALAILWSLASIFTYTGTGSIPEWMLGITLTCVGWFFVSREVEKVRFNAKRN